MTGQTNRVRRVERQLLELLTHFMHNGLGIQLPCYATVTAVDMSVNLRHARVFFRLVGEAAVAKATEELLTANRGRFQKHVASQLNIKFCPVLKFEFGHVERRDEIDILLENLHKPKTFGD